MLLRTKPPQKRINMKTFKWIGIILLIAAFSVQSNAQIAKKYCLFEHFTQASCGPCASQNPIFQGGILVDNEGDVHHIAIHTWWPGIDPMYLYNASHSASRVNYYSIGGVPTIVMEGTWQGLPTSVTQAMVDNIIGTGSPIRIEVKEDRQGLTDNITVTITSVGIPPPVTYRLRIMVVEKLVTYTNPPGSNGERIFPNVFRRMLPHSAGVSYSPAAQGMAVTFNETYTLDPANTDTSQIYIIAFVQDMATKEILNSGSSLDDPYISGINDNVSSVVPLMSQNYPNPANDETFIGLFNVNSSMQFQVYDLLGNMVFEQFVNETERTVSVPTSDLSNGLYIYRLVSEGAILESRKMTILHQ